MCVCVCVCVMSVFSDYQVRELLFILKEYDVLPETLICFTYTCTIRALSRLRKSLTVSASTEASYGFEILVVKKLVLAVNKGSD